MRASKVDTGSRGRKRTREGAALPSTPGGEDTTPDETGSNTPSGRENEDEGVKAEKITSGLLKKAVTSASGFVHILRPTPELWTYSLPHRTQVVYTPDYSYILNRIRARPGTRIIEAGAGSGSFTHASVRAVYNGAPTSPTKKKGKVFSFEFNESRYQKMQEEVESHKLQDFVEMRHRDVYADGFLADGKSPLATAVFLDLPAPWKALHHLSRRQPKVEGNDVEIDPDWVSPLDPNQSAHLCTFSPCIEQVTQTVTELRKLGWIDIQMVEVAHKKLNIVRDRVGLDLPKDKGVNPSPSSVMEAVSRLRELNKKAQEFHARTTDNTQMDLDNPAANQQTSPPSGTNGQRDTDGDKYSFANGRLVHRPEAEIKTHTSYLVFAILPQEWSEDEEAAAYARWPCGSESRTIGSVDKAARKQEKRELYESKRKKQKL